MYESGNREPNIETIKVIANFFNVSSDYLIGLTDIRQSCGILLNEKDKTFAMDYIPNEAKKELDIFLSYIEYKYILNKDK